jgi:methionyl-tRNA synthetase
MFKFIARKPKVEHLAENDPCYEFSMITLFCPHCKRPFATIDKEGYCFDYFTPYCRECGQKMNFSEWKNKKCKECGVIKIDGNCFNCDRIKREESKKKFIDLCNLYDIQVKQNSDNPGFFILEKGGSTRELTKQDLENMFT